MTKEVREKTIRIFEGAIKCNEKQPCHDNCFVCQYNKMLSNGDTFPYLINALEALKQEPCEDAISREAVLKIIDGYGVSMDGNKTYESVCNGLVRATKIAMSDAIKKLPSVTPTREHGEWLEEWESRQDINGEYDEWVEYKCSKCGFQDINIDSCSIKRYKFCPCCGAEMEGSK